ncbi:hypothetical protein BC826DRAFT_437699 [Russula brevipes]|nr:hypothetical protein BC826DRAFT_437699 [Russula brevipes]
MIVVRIPWCASPTLLLGTADALSSSEACVEPDAFFCACESFFFTDQPRLYACSGRVVNRAHVRKRCRSPAVHLAGQFVIEDPDAPCAVLQVYDIGPNTNRKAPPPPPRRSAYLVATKCLSQLAVPTRTGEGYNVNALCARCCRLRAVSTKTHCLLCFVLLPLRRPAVSQRAQDRAHRMHLRT